MMFLRILVLSLIFVTANTSYGEEITTIPLDQIWALDMPNTQDIQKLDPRKNLQVKNNTIVATIRRELFVCTELKEKAGPCFLVLGEGKEALKEMAKVIADKKEHEKILPAGKLISLAFYSFSAPGYVQIHSVKRTDSLITVRYQIVIHQTTEATVHFALIPIGKLADGKFTVEILEVAPPTPYRNQALSNRAVCDSTTFTIKKEASP